MQTGFDGTMVLTETQHHGLFLFIDLVDGVK